MSLTSQEDTGATTFNITTRRRKTLEASFCLSSLSHKEDQYHTNYSFQGILTKGEGPVRLTFSLR
jgi:hypothetical protein